MIIEVILITAVLLISLYWIGTRNYNYWSQRGVPCTRPWVPFLGDASKFFFLQTTFLQFIQDIRNAHKDKRFAGVYNFSQPILVINDPQLMKVILVKDFDYFTNRNNFLDPESDPMLGKNLLSLEDQRWREVRNILSPTFTSSKMKTMFELIDQCAGQVTNYIKKRIESQLEDKHKDGPVLKIEMKDLFTRFTNDVIATTAFGIKVDSLSDMDNDFYLKGREITKFGFKTSMLMMLYLAFPSLMKRLKITLFGKSLNQFYTNLVLDTVKEREEKKIVRPDLINLLMQAREGKLDENGQKRQGLDNDDIVSQAVLFFFAGFETISTFLSFTVYELAVNQDVQNKLRDEIDDVIEKNGGKLTYEGVMVQMKYLDAVCNEVLRKWPPAPMTDRKVSKKYKLEGINGEPDVYLERGDLVWIPIGALHYDPEYFPQPEKFDPERFSEENKNKIDTFSYMPFGIGPRSCIGNRFALMESKACLVHLLRNFTLEVTEKTQIPLKLKRTMQFAAEKGYWIGLKSRTK